MSSLKDADALAEENPMLYKIVIFAAPIIYLNHTVDGLLKTVELKNLAINFKYLAYQ